LACSKKEPNIFRIYRDKNGTIQIALGNDFVASDDIKRTIANFVDLKTNFSEPAISRSTVLKNQDGHKIIYSNTGVDETWSETGAFSEGLVPVKIGTNWGYADINGRVAINAIYDHVSGFKNGYSIVETTIH
jgi:hypothetical protein